MTQKFSSGDVVRLRSGGPLMTVERYDLGTHVFCSWFDPSRTRHNDYFLESMLIAMPTTTRPLVLVVEDDVEHRDALRHALEADGFRVIGVTHGDEALQILRGSTPPEVVLLDLQMPVMDGWQFLEEQSRDPRLKDVPVVVITSKSNAVLKPLKNDVLLKPLNLESLGVSLGRIITHSS